MRSSDRRFVLAVLALALAACGGDDDDGGGGGDKDAAPPGSDAALVDAAPLDAPGTMPGVGAQCGSELCAQGTGCCTGSMTACRTPANCPTQIFLCDGAEDCGGGTCCFGNQGAGGSECRAAGSSCAQIACHADAECGGGTPKCCPKPFTPYKVCQASCT